MFGPSGPGESSSVDLGPLEVYFKPVITDLGFKLTVFLNWKEN